MPLSHSLRTELMKPLSDSGGLFSQRHPLATSHLCKEYGMDTNIIIDVMRTHLLIIVGGILQENPFYVPPDEFVRELRERCAANGRTALSAS